MIRGNQIFRIEVFYLFDRLKEDIAAVRERDPAARSVLEILLLYPGLKAVRMHRRAHWCLVHNLRFMARWISQRAVRKTGIEIHPGATIGRRLFIDHGSGVVIGETTEIGDDVTIYQGVTLGGTGKDIGKRHPTIGNNVMIGSGAKVLGPFRVGDNVKIAAGATVLREVPPNCTAVGVPARVVRRNGRRVDPYDQTDTPDLVAQEICQLRRRLHRLEREMQLVASERFEEGGGV
jgi:serine O-acetyltransferase